MGSAYTQTENKRNRTVLHSQWHNYLHEETQNNLQKKVLEKVNLARFPDSRSVYKNQLYFYNCQWTLGQWNWGKLFTIVQWNWWKLFTIVQEVMNT